MFTVEHILSEPVEGNYFKVQVDHLIFTDFDQDSFKQRLTMLLKHCIVTLSTPVEVESYDLDYIPDNSLTYLSDLIKMRPHPFITGSELSLIMKWKLKHGIYRPKLQHMIDQLDDVDVRRQSEKAFAYLRQDQLRLAFKEMTELAGVGPATASLVFSLYDMTVPFMSDRAILCVSDQLKYTIPVALNVIEFFRTTVDMTPADRAKLI